MRALASFPRQLAAALLGVIAAGPQSTSSADATSPSALIGMKITTTQRPIDMRYPFGWQTVTNDRYGWFVYKTLKLIKVRKGSKYALLLQAQLPDQLHTPPSEIVTDAISVNDPTDYQHFSPHCSDEKIVGNIVAEVRFENSCDLETSNVVRAWRINTANARFERVVDTSRLICFFGYASDLDVDIRKNCDKTLLNGKVDR